MKNLLFIQESKASVSDVFNLRNIFGKNAVLAQDAHSQLGGHAILWNNSKLNYSMDYANESWMVIKAT